MRELRAVGVFTGGYLLAALVLSVYHRNWEFVYYIGVVSALAGITVAVHGRARLPRGVLWTLSVWGLLHMIGGLVSVPLSWPIHGSKAVVYSLWLIPEMLKYDQVVHAYGFGIATWLCFEALRSALPNIRPTLGIVSLCALAGMGLGAVNEIVEFIAVLVIPETNVGGYENTGWDLVANAVGAIGAAWSILAVHTRRRIRASS